MARCPIKADSPARDELSISKLVIRLSLNSKASILRFSSGSASGQAELAALRTVEAVGCNRHSPDNIVLCDLLDQGWIGGNDIGLDAA